MRSRERVRITKAERKKQTEGFMKLWQRRGSPGQIGKSLRIIRGKRSKQSLRKTIMPPPARHGQQQAEKAAHITKLLELMVNKDNSRIFLLMKRSTEIPTSTNLTIL